MRTVWTPPLPPARHSLMRFYGAEQILDWDEPHTRRERIAGLKQLAAIVEKRENQVRGWGGWGGHLAGSPSGSRQSVRT